MPSYGEDVAPIFAERCNGCHFPGNTQSEDVFTEYEDIFDQRQTVLTRIYSCAMPPPGVASLGTSERQTLLRWFVCGAPAD